MFQKISFNWLHSTGMWGPCGPRVPYPGFPDGLKQRGASHASAQRLSPAQNLPALAATGFLGLWANVREDSRGRQERFPPGRGGWGLVALGRAHHQSTPAAEPGAPYAAQMPAARGRAAATRRHGSSLPPRAFPSAVHSGVTWARGARPLPRSSPPLPADKRVQMSPAARVSGPLPPPPPGRD